MDKETLKDNIELVHHLKSLPALQFFGQEDLKRILRFSKLKKYKAGERGNCQVEKVNVIWIT
jgi:hypothetical protein